jgi:hypothetical protein
MEASVGRTAVTSAAAEEGTSACRTGGSTGWLVAALDTGSTARKSSAGGGRRAQRSSLQASCPGAALPNSL